MSAKKGTAAPAKRRPPDASMELLTSIQRDTIEPEYGVHYGEHRPARGRSRWLMLAICFLAGLMFATSSMGTGRGADDAAGERSDLISQINAAQQRNAELQAQADELANQVHELEQDRLGQQVRFDDSAQVMSGVIPVSGPGIVLIITDSPDDETGIIVDQDIRQVVNGLWLAGAESISVNDHRLSTRTAIRQAGSAITVDYKSLTGPYRIEVIGDPDTLATNFGAGPGGAWLNFLKRNHGVSWTLGTSTELELGADPGLDTDNAGVR